MHQDFINAIIAQPDEKTPFLIFADWLEEQGDPKCERLRAYMNVFKTLEGIKTQQCSQCGNGVYGNCEFSKFGLKYNSLFTYLTYSCYLRYFPYLYSAVSLGRQPKRIIKTKGYLTLWDFLPIEIKDVLPLLELKYLGFNTEPLDKKRIAKFIKTYSQKNVNQHIQTASAMLSKATDNYAYAFSYRSTVECFMRRVKTAIFTNLEALYAT